MKTKKLILSLIILAIGFTCLFIGLFGVWLSSIPIALMVWA